MVIATMNEGDGSMIAARTRVKSLGSAKSKAQLRALLLVAPLLIFLLLVFVLPIALLLTRAVDNRAASAALPYTMSALSGWDEQSAPDEALFAAFATDLKQSPRDQIAEVAKRLNYYETGMRSMLLKTARTIRDAKPPYKAAFVAIDPKWETPHYWTLIKNASPPFTDYYLLASLDLERDASGAIGRVSAENAVHVDVLIRTFIVSASVTVICLFLGYPLAALIARSKGAVANTLLILVLLPFWTSLLVRTSAWVVLLQGRGVINSALIWLGLIDPAHPLDLIYNRIGVLIAMTHILLPFMVLPIYSVMKSIPPVYLRAASSLGAPPISAFLRIYLPMSMPGVSAGGLLVFILALGYYITPALV
ncbi:ABC transporter permease, partial [Rhizobium leguminosarum]